MNDSGYGALFYRYTTILNLIPNYPDSITTNDILRHLEAKGISTSVRGLQRDLADRLSLYFPIICLDETRPFRWSLDVDYDFNIPYPRQNPKQHVCECCMSGT